MPQSHDLRSGYINHVAKLEQRLKSDKPLSEAVGGEFVAVGKLEFYLLRALGLEDSHLVVDVGCGSGRLASQLAGIDGIRYIGTDVVPRLLAHATDICRRPDWQFVATEGITIPCLDGIADFVCFFSVFTHLAHEDTYRYFREAARVLKPGGQLVMSFLEFLVPSHWDHFFAFIDQGRENDHLNQFFGRDAIAAWANKAGLEICDIHRGDSMYIPLPDEVHFDGGRCMSGSGSLGQSVAVLRKPV